MSENRHFSRVGFEAETWLETSGKRFDVHLHDLSLKGALVSFDGQFPLAEGEICPLHIKLSGSDIVLSFQSRLLHIDGQNLGFKFEILDIESLTHLRSIMEANIGDTAIIDRELFFFPEG